MSNPASPVHSPAAAENPSVSAQTPENHSPAAKSPRSEKDLSRVASVDLCPERAFTSLMTFDASGNPTLVPLREADRDKLKFSELAPEVTGSTAAAWAEEDDIPSEGELDMEQETGSFTCAPCGCTRTPKPVVEEEEEAEKVDEALLEPRVLGENEEVIEEHIVSFYTMPSRTCVTLGEPKELSCPQPLSSYLPASPFCTRDGRVAVDVYAVKADMTRPCAVEEIPEYSVVPQMYKRRDTLARSMHEPRSIDLF
ncbi:hypothetical protein BESB_011110 [Besnoitia besnoiti]|uniref:Uncharacterized protein n=1 Tax=Besnoitia besnoiti TaxID=94643 RepID=A0A2A9MLC2_BESBE|nr:hypothetical protein BESB_011110 [Besnoitia besnoiti]PFH38769.1 hypothetical protein BESB_011110 [Besnoitia besnoiti]